VPQIEFTLPRGALSGDAIDSLMGEMTTTLLRYEGAPDNEASREISWGFVHEADRVYNGGAPLSRPATASTLPSRRARSRRRRRTRSSARSRR